HVVRFGIRHVERGVETVARGAVADQFFEMPDFIQDDSRRERQRGDGRPWRDGAVIGAERRAARGVVEELTGASAIGRLHVAGTIGGRKAPAILFVTGEPTRIAARVFALDFGGDAAVLEVVGVLRTHELVADAARVDPDVREL